MSSLMLIHQAITTNTVAGDWTMKYVTLTI